MVPKLVSSRELSTDLLVVGGGLSGVCAAIAAARNGARVVLVQDRSVLGGNASSEIRMHVMGADTATHKPGSRETGILEELKLEDAVRNPHRSFSQWDLLLYEKVKAEPNITLLLDTTCTAAEVETRADGTHRIIAAHALRNSTEDAFRIIARWFADCSGDGRLGAEAGADFVAGREARATFGEALAEEAADGHHLGASMMFMAREHATPQPFIAPSWTRKFPKEFRTKRPFDDYGYGYWWIEWGGHLDAIKDNEEIRHELLRIALGIWDYIKNSGEHPGAANYALDWVAPLPGKRESRRFLGRHVLTQHDVFNPAAREDAVAYGGWPVDLHPIQGMDATDQPPCVWHRFPHLYSIPYGCYCSRNVENLFFAGRNISASHIAFGSTRVMATCAIGGQAVGAAAALLQKHGASSTAGLATAEGLAELRQCLARDDAFVPGVRNEDPADIARSARVSASSEATGFFAAAVLDGHSRALRAEWGPWVAEGAHAWRSVALPATLCLELPEPRPLREIHLTFDSGLDRPLVLSGSEYMTNLTVRGPQPELARHYRLRVDGELIAEETFNFLRKRVHALPIPRTARAIELEILATHGVPEARLHEIRLYA